MLTVIHYKFWGFIYQVALKRVQRYQMHDLTDYDFLDRVELEYDQETHLKP